MKNLVMSAVFVLLLAGATTALADHDEGNGNSQDGRTDPQPVIIVKPPVSMLAQCREAIMELTNVSTRNARRWGACGGEDGQTWTPEAYGNTPREGCSFRALSCLEGNLQNN